MASRSVVSIVTTTACALVVASCSRTSRPQPAPVRTPLPAAAPVVDVTMSEYAFDYDPAVPPGRVVFRARNMGSIPHRITLFSLADDVPPIDVQLRGAERRLVEPIAGFYNRPPGEVGTFAVDLAPNQRYALICFVVDADGASHAVKGMSSEFRTAPVGGAG